MRIKKLEFCGFKSFVDPTVLELSSGISAIVGPNGCGKSNLVDALRWVLGEQSPSRLRGGAMEDVLFNGSAHRGPVGMAEVSLLLENEGGPSAEELPEALRDVAEILVTRRYFRSGESEYLINRRPCRLKDITELFLGTGAGNRAYSVIEQGKVDQLVNAKPEDIRLFIEEAAGTTRYRSRRIAAERKLERTRDNLARANDLLREIDRSIAIFRRLAKRAEQYRQLQEELRQVELQLGRRRRDKFMEDIESSSGQCASLRSQETELAAQIESLDTERVSSRTELTDVETDLHGQQEKLFELRRSRERAEARIEMLDRDVMAARERLGKLAEEQVQLGNRVIEITGEAEGLSAELASLVDQRRVRGEELATSLASRRTEETELSQLTESLESAKNEIVDFMSSESGLRNTILSVEQRVGERETERKRLSGELNDLGAEVIRRTAQVESIVLQRAELEHRFGALEVQLEEARAEAEMSRSIRTELEQAGVAQARAVAETESRFESAEEVEEGFTRYQQGVRTIMQRHQGRTNGVLNLVAHVLETPPELERAVAAVLGDRLQHVIVKRPEDACEAIEELRSLGAGRSSFVPMDSGVPGLAPVPVALLPAGGKRLIDLVRVEAGYADLAASLLGDAVLVDNLEQALGLFRQNGATRTIVTPDGDVFRPDGVVSGGSEAPYEEQLLAHRREVRRLGEDRARLQEEQAALEVRRVEAVEKASVAASRLEELEAEHRELAPARVGLRKDEERAREELSVAASRQVRLGGNDTRLEAEISTFAAEREAAIRDLSVASESRERLQGSRSVLEQSLSERRSSLETRTRKTTDLKVEVAQLEGKEGRLQETIERQHALRIDLEKRASSIKAESEQISESARAAEIEVREIRATLAGNQEFESEHDASVGRARERALTLRTRIEELEGLLGTTRRGLDKTRAELSQIELSLAEKSMHRDSLENEIRERYQIELSTVALEPGEESELAERFEQLRGRVDRLGGSRAGDESVGELEDEEKRREFLLEQKVDLESSVADLQKTISSLNRASRDRFQETFEAVNLKFQEMFPKLFPGGRAKLMFTDESNLLETGVDIQVQPPGMNLRALSLLSGGQKALTAVSLMFSLFLCRPSPFCVLDEVDAPLDDANIDRFSGIVAEMGHASQFLLITHNKRTMEIAETLYGVTMEEPGVSKIVSVRFEHAA